MYKRQVQGAVKLPQWCFIHIAEAIENLNIFQMCIRDRIHLCLIILLLLFCSSSQVFAAARVNVKNTRIKLSATKLTYNKKVQRPKVRVTYKGKVLKEKKNYIVKYSKGCKKVGTDVYKRQRLRHLGKQPDTQ